MRISRNIASLCVLLAALLLCTSGAYAQDTTAVTMVGIGDVIKSSLPTAADYFIKDARLSEHAFAKIEAVGNFRPEASELKFFYGRDAKGRLVGTVFFNTVGTLHGTVQVGVAFDPGGAVSNVVVTKATVGTEPWIKALMASGFMKDFNGMSGHSTSNPLKNISESKVGAMPYFMAQVITEAVTRAIVYYDVLFRPYIRK